MSGNLFRGETKFEEPFNLQFQRLIIFDQTKISAGVQSTPSPDRLSVKLVVLAASIYVATEFTPNGGTVLMGHAASMDLYSAFYGDPVNYFDPDGRCWEKAATWSKALASDAMDAHVREFQRQTLQEYQSSSVLNTYRVYNRAISLGDSPVDAGYQAFGYGGGSLTGFKQFYQGWERYDISGLREMGPFESRMQMGLGTAQIIGTGLTLQQGGAYVIDNLNWGVKPKPTMEVPGGLMQEAARLQRAWPEQMQVVRQSGQLFAMGTRRTLSVSDIVAGMEINPAEVNIFRGGSALPVREGVDVKMVGKLVQPSRGVSLFTNPTRVAQWGAFQVESIPAELKIIQRGQNLEHFEIMPREAMPLDQFQQLLNGVILKPLAK